jgi:tetratricopeptide (TPR) repeat protein
MESIDYIVYQKDFNKFIEEEILRDLSKAEKIILKSASVYRYPIHSRALLIRSEYAGVNYDSLSKLIKRSLIQELPENKFDTHDFIKEFFYERLTPREIRVYHVSAANYYSEQSGDFAGIEMLFHLIKAKEYNDAAKLAMEAGHGLIYKGYVEFINILEEFNPGNLRPELWEEILVLKGDAALRMGAFDSAIEYYKDDLELLSEKQDAKKIIELYEKMGEAHGKKGEWDKSIIFLKKSIELCSEQDDKKVMARAQNNLGLAYRNIRNYNEALKHYRRAIKLLNEQNEVVGISLTNINIGKINELQNDFDRALYLYNESLLTFKDAKYNPGIIKAHNAIGNLYLRRNHWNKAIKEFLESLKVSEKINDKNNIITVSTNIGDSFYHLKIYDSALEFYYQSMNNIEELIALQKSYNPYSTSKYRSIFSGKPAEQSEFDRADLERIMIEYRENLGKVHNKIGNVHRARKNFSIAIKSHTKSRKIYQESRNKKSLAKTNINLGIDYQLKGEYNNALGSYKSALKELEALKEYIGMVVTYNNIGKIYELKGKEMRALEFYKKSLLLSKQVRFRAGVKKANVAIKNITKKKRGVC